VRAFAIVQVYSPRPHRRRLARRCGAPLTRGDARVMRGEI